MKRTCLALAAALGLAAAVPAFAHHDGEVVEKAGVRASHAHIEEPAAASHGIHVYLTIENVSDTADRLVAASVPFAAEGRIEANVLAEDGSLAVRTVPALAVDAGQTIVLQPGAIRIAFDDVQRALNAGDHFELTLTFENAGTLTMVGEVEAGDGHEHDHDHADGHTHEHEHEEPAS